MKVLEDNLITIIIPTYNQTTPLLKNLECLSAIFRELKLTDKIEILISDDCSKNETHVPQIKKYIGQSNLKITLFEHDVNLGIEKNELFLIEQVQSKYAMLLGEDDYLNKELIQSIINYLCEPTNDISCIICNYYSIDESGKVISKNRDEAKVDKIYEKGDIRILYKAHQMSGLVFEVDGLVESYVKNCKTNVYPQIYFVGYSMLRGRTLHITQNPFENTVLKKRRFDYSLDMLTSEILIGIFALDIDRENKLIASKTYLKSEFGRYCNLNTWLHPFQLFHKINTSYKFDKEISNYMKKQFLLSYFKIPILTFRLVIRKIFG